MCEYVQVLLTWLRVVSVPNGGGMFDSEENKKVPRKSFRRFQYYGKITSQTVIRIFQRIWIFSSGLISVRFFSFLFFQRNQGNVFALVQTGFVPFEHTVDLLYRSQCYHIYLMCFKFHGNPSNRCLRYFSLVLFFSFLFFLGKLSHTEPTPECDYTFLKTFGWDNS